MTKAEKKMFPGKLKKKVCWDYPLPDHFSNGPYPSNFVKIVKLKVRDCKCSEYVKVFLNQIKCLVPCFCDGFYRATSNTGNWFQLRLYSMLAND